VCSAEGKHVFLKSFYFNRKQYDGFQNLGCDFDTPKRVEKTLLARQVEGYHLRKELRQFVSSRTGLHNLLGVRELRPIAKKFMKFYETDDFFNFLTLT